MYKSIKYIIYIAIIYFLIDSSCSFRYEDTTSTVLKEISNDELTIQWLRSKHSKEFIETTDIIIAKKDYAHDTVCIAQNVTNIDFFYNLVDPPEIIIGFIGSPHNTSTETYLVKDIFDYTVSIDTNYIKESTNNRSIVYHGSLIDKNKDFWSTETVDAIRFTPTKSQAILAERIIKNNIDYLKMNQPQHEHSYKIADNIDKYLRQYVGFINEKGEDIIWINFLIDEFYNPIALSEGIVLVDDGGSYYWSVYVNLTKKELYGIRINASV